MGELARAGRRPRRTVIYAAWDAEEPGLLGSTEWAEHHADELRQKTVAYINTDSNGRGFLGVGGSHALERFVNQVARDLTDPQRNVSVLERVRARRLVNGDRDVASGDLPIGALGSGSDYTPFLQHLTISSLNVGYGGESGGGSYHSAYDTYEHYTRFINPGLVYGTMLSKTTGRMTLRLANADVLPFRFTNLVHHVKEYADEVMQLAKTMRDETKRHNELASDNAFVVAADPTETYVPPAAKAPVPFINFAPLQNAVSRLEESATRYDEAVSKAFTSGGPTAEQATRVNAIVAQSERAVALPDGLPRREWFRHAIYAPGFYTGYGVKTLPGVREGIEQRAWDEVDREMVKIAAALERLAAELDEATAVLGGS